MRLSPARVRRVLPRAPRATAGRRLLATALALGVLTALSAATATPAAHAQADPTGCAAPVDLDIQNGGFENPAAPPATGTVITQLPGWTVSGKVTLVGPGASFASGSQALALGDPMSGGAVSQVLDGTVLAGTTLTLQITSLRSGTVSLGGESRPVSGSAFAQQTHAVTFVVPADAPADLELVLTGTTWIVDQVTAGYVACDRAPVAVDDTATTVQNTPLSVPAPAVLGNDTDPDGDPLTATLVTRPAHGTVALAAGGAFTYTPAAGYVGTDTFTYTASDGTATSQPATVSIAVTAATCDIPPPPGSILGTEGNNLLNGTGGGDLIYALGGNDVIDGRGGDDLICGGTGNDAISGGAGNDRASGEAGNDAISGGDGDDRVSGDAGNDALNGGAGTNVVDGGAGTDICRNPTAGPGCP